MGGYSEDTKWFALHVRSRHEKTVHAKLEAKHHEVFLPSYTVENKWADRIKNVTLPLFPGYIFCRFEAANKSSVISTSGVIDIVRIGADPAPIENSEIEAIQTIVSSQVQIEPYSHLVRGEKVILTQGPLSGLTGTLTNIRNRVRLVVSVELLCRSVLVEVDRNWVVPAAASRPKFMTPAFAPSPSLV